MTISMYERAQKVIPPAAGRATKLGVVRGEGTFLFSEDGKKYIDFASGVAVCNVGHNHPQVVKAVKEQITNLIHGGHNVVYYESYVKLAETLVALTGNDTMVYFSNSGAEANEGSMKLAKYVTKRPAVLAFKHGFHGRTLGTVSITSSNASFRKNYEGLMPSVYFAEYPNCFRCPFGQKSGACQMECLKQFDVIFKHLIDPESIASMIIEPVQGEGGYIVPPTEFMQGLRKVCDQYGICLIFDEIQTGFGRTGKMFAYEHFGFSPDIMSCAKSIGSGFPLSAVIGKAELMKQWPAGSHGGTFGGNPVACAAALATIDLLNNGLIENAAEMGRYLKERLMELKEKYNVIGDVRGLGLMVGAEFVDPDNNPNGVLADKIRSYCLNKGLILLACGAGHETIRFIAPTTITKDILNEALEIFEAGIQQSI